jgi:uncharacterized Tic20 family protein
MNNSQSKTSLNYFISVIVLGFVAVVLIIAGFFVPPMGIIDGSVIKAVGELFAFAALFEIPHCIIIAKDKNISIKHNNTEVKIDSDCDEKVS